MKKKWLIFIWICGIFGLPSYAEELDFGSLYEPDSVVFKFETPGWYILFGILLMFALVYVARSIRKRIRNKFIREALKELNKLHPAKAEIKTVFVLLKKVATHIFGRNVIASLHGLEWLQYLDRTGKNVNFTALNTQINAAIYEDKDLELELKQRILTNAKHWISTHAR